MRTVMIILIAFVIVTESNAQTLTQRRLEFGIADIITSGIIGGVGAILHKNTNQTNLQAFKKGFIKASIGGTINYAAYLNSWRMEHNWGYAYLNKSLNAIGASSIENAALNKPIFNTIAIDYGPIRVDIGKNSKIRLQPFATLGFLSAAVVTKGNINLTYSLKYGTPVFINTKTLQIDGITLVNSIILPSKPVNGVQFINGKFVPVNNPLVNTLAHELVHTYQYRNYSAVSNLYLAENNKYLYYDMPNILGSYGINSLKSTISGSYYSNYYENEAESLSNRYVPH